MTRPNDAALAAFLARKAEIDALLERLRTHSDEHFGLAPDAVGWGHAGALDDHAARLRELSDAVFGEGSCAPDA
ncbi:MAG: hypothetical protein AAGF76_00900 [Pseudomonadota bacterium]